MDGHTGHMTLVGGREVEVFTNHRCSVCGKEMHDEVMCRRIGGNICQGHCMDRGDGKKCAFYIDFTQNCAYTTMERNKKIRQMSAGPSHRST